MVTHSEIESGEALFELGIAYEDGHRHVVKDTEFAIQLYEKSAAQGFAEACYHLGCMYAFESDPQWTPIDLDLAKRWYRAGAEQGSVNATFAIVEMIEYEELTDDEDGAMARWLVNTVEQGYRRAVEEIAWRYRDGVGLPKDIAKSYLWTRVEQIMSRERGANPGLDELRKALTEQQINDTEKQAIDWIENHKGYDPSQNFGHPRPDTDFGALGSDEAVKVTKNYKGC